MNLFPALTNSLYKEYRALVVSVARKRLVRDDLADDCVQEVWLRVALHEAQGKPWPADLKNWLLGIVVHVAADILRGELRCARIGSIELSGEIDAASAKDDPAPASAIHDEQEHRLKLAREAMSRLRTEDATIVRLHHERDMTFPAIAALLKLPLEHVKYRYRKGRSRLKQLTHTHTQAWARGVIPLTAIFSNFSAPIGLRETTNLIEDLIGD